MFKFLDRKTKKMMDEAHAYADSRGVYLYDQTPRELQVRERLWICFWRGLVCAAVVASFVCLFSSTMKIPALLSPVIITSLAVGMVLSFSGYNQFIYNVCLIPYFILFAVYSFFNLRILNSGFSTIVNRIIHAVDDVYHLGGVREYTELVADRQRTTTTTLSLIAAVAVLFLFMTMKSNRRRYLSLIIADFLAFGFFFLVRLDPQISWVAFVLGAQVTFILLQNSLHNRTPFRKEGVTYKKSSRETLYSYVVQKNSGTMWKSLTLGAVLMFLIFLVLSPITGMFYYNPIPREKTPARAALDRMISDLTMNGLAGLFSEYDSVGGVSSGQLGGISNVTMDFQTDLVVDFVPYTFDRIFLKQHTYETYYREGRINWAGIQEQTSRWIADGSEFAGDKVKEEMNRIQRENELGYMDPSEQLQALMENPVINEQLSSYASEAERGVKGDPNSLQQRMVFSTALYPYGGIQDPLSSTLNVTDKEMVADWFRESYMHGLQENYSDSFTAKTRITFADNVDPAFPYGAVLADQEYFEKDGTPITGGMAANLYLDHFQPFVLPVHPDHYQVRSESVSSFDKLREEVERNSSGNYSSPDYLLGAPSMIPTDPGPLMEAIRLTVLGTQVAPALDSEEYMDEYKRHVISSAYSDYYIHQTCTAVPADLKEYITGSFAPMYGLDVPGEKVLGAQEYGVSNYGYGEFIDRLQYIFRTQYMYTYSPGKTPKDREFIRYFLEYQKHGYCVYFASAATMILRSYGIPARYCEGYAIDISEIIDNGELLEEEDVSEWFEGRNSFENAGVITLDVNDSSAHAWVEVYYEGYGWIPVEFTVAPMESGQAAEFWSGLGNLFQGLNNVNDDPDIDPNQQNPEEYDYTPPDFNSILKKFLGSTGILLAVAVVLILLYLAVRELIRHYRLFGQKDLSGRIISQYQNLNRILSPVHRGGNPNAYHSHTARLLTEEYGADPAETDRFIKLVERVSYSRKSASDEEEYRFSESFYRGSVQRIREVRKKKRAEKRSGAKA